MVFLDGSCVIASSSPAEYKHPEDRDLLFLLPVEQRQGMLAPESYVQPWAGALWPLNQDCTEFSYLHPPCTPPPPGIQPTPLGHTAWWQQVPSQDDGEGGGGGGRGCVSDVCVF